MPRNIPQPGPLFCALAAIAACCPSVRAQTHTITYCDLFPLPTTTTDQHGQPFTVTGLSGICYLGGSSFAAVMDNSNKVVFLTITTDAGGCISTASISAGLTLTDSHDFEGIAATATSLYISDEDTPAVHEFSITTGQRLRTLTTPPIFVNRRANFGFESLTFAGGSLFTANEEALTVDGPVSTQSQGTWVRILRYDQAPGGWVPAAQFAYRTQPLHGIAVTGSRSGVSDLAALPDGALISLERSFALSALGLFENRIYELNFTSATNVAALGSINSGGFTPVAKSPLWIGQIGQNMEGLTVGPRLAWSRWSLIGIIDDGDPASENNLVAFAVSSDICYADFNQDGGIDGADVEAFLTAWTDGAPESEINNDGGIDGADVAAFFEAWEAGGCG